MEEILLFCYSFFHLLLLLLLTFHYILLQQGVHMIFKIVDFISNTNLNIIGCLKKSVLFKRISNFFSRSFRQDCYLWTQFSQLLKGQIGKFWCLSHQKPPYFSSQHFPKWSYCQKTKNMRFFGTPCLEMNESFKEMKRI